MRIAFGGAALCLAVLALNGCGGGAPVVTNQNTPSVNQTTTSNTGGQRNGSPAPAATPKQAAPTAAGNARPVDTSKYDAEIKRLEEKAKKKPVDAATRLALAKAYTARGDALTGVQQYRAALGDYRRALRNDPNNEQAQQMAGTIIGILRSMGRDVPPEGQEPAPLPLKQ